MSIEFDLSANYTVTAHYALRDVLPNALHTV